MGALEYDSPRAGDGAILRRWPGPPRPLAAAFTASALGASLLVATACNGSTAGTGGGGAASTGNAWAAPRRPARRVGGSFPVDAGSCATDLLHTGPPRPCSTTTRSTRTTALILEFTAKYHEPDAMIFKAIIYVESRFQYDAVGCTGNSNCCPQRGWTGAECGCPGSDADRAVVRPFGTSQQGCTASDPRLAPERPRRPGDGARRPPDWSNSVFNPAVNIDLGVAGIACNRAQAKAQFPGCTEDQYTMMAIGNFNSYGSTQSCTVYNFPYDSSVLDAYNMYASAAGWPAHPYVTN